MTPAVLRALAVLLLLLGTSLPAYAHDKAHEIVDTQSDTGARLDGSPHHRLSPSCPGTPGQLCCCGSLVAAPGGAKPSVVIGVTWELITAAPAPATAVQGTSLAFSSALTAWNSRPRAPPVSS